jgi:ArsR family transcriptional regulator
MDLKQIERISKALGDPHRIKIMQTVRQREWTQCADICGMIDLTQSAISHHIKQLVDAGLLIPEKEGRNIKYTIDKEVITSYMNFLMEMKG